uniref:Putative secreted peptide n=1 Tax=Anopheles braziliensis TaxID=58242 RepID=A0A2M3ZSJ5_9DIPT
MQFSIFCSVDVVVKIMFFQVTFAVSGIGRNIQNFTLIGEREVSRFEHAFLWRISIVIAQLTITPPRTTLVRWPIEFTHNGTDGKESFVMMRHTIGWNYRNT